MTRFYSYLLSLCTICFCYSCSEKTIKEKRNLNLERGQSTLDSLYKYYGIENTSLLRETYPFDNCYTATYLASEEQTNIPNQYSYLWPYSGTFSAVNVLLESTQDPFYEELLEKKVLNGLEEYYDCLRIPCGYASYINGTSQSDRFYDDNVWLGIDFADIYLQTRKARYLQKAKLIWEFVLSGEDDQLGGGIYWCEQKKESKNTCSNAPGSVFAFKLFEATRDSLYFFHGKELYEWTKQKLQDPADHLYYDNIKLDGRIGKAKYAYNSGQMMQAGALLYKFTQEEEYLIEAQQIARSCYDFFFDSYTTEWGENIQLLRKGDIWFTAVMLRGFIELYQLDGITLFMDAFQKNLDYAWEHARNEKGLFSVDWSGENQDQKKWLLTQAAMAEMYARMSMINK